MAITQISRITHRKGLNENLPQLAGAELGWALDQRKLYIGNGKIADGAPTVGNTEILTEYSDILSIAASYTYKGSQVGYTAQTGVDSNNPVKRTLQQKFDDFASVRDFGATGDGSTDDTAAIQRALDQLFIQDTNPKVRRSLFFPAGTYIVSDTIKIPTYAKLWGEGLVSSVIKYVEDGNSATEVVTFADSLGQIGTNLGQNSATIPQDIEIQSMGFETDTDHDILLVNGAKDCFISNVSFIGPKTTANISAANDNASIRIKAETVYIPSNITFDNIKTEGLKFGVYSVYDSKGITVSNSKLTVHSRAVVLGPKATGQTSGPQGYRIQQCLFDDVYSKGVEFNSVSLNVSAYNVFLDVGNALNGAGNPTSSIVEIIGANNISVGDMFERDDTDNASYKRISLNEVQSIGFDGGKQLQLGSYAQDSGQVITLANNSNGDIDIDLTNKHTITTGSKPTLSNFVFKYALMRPISGTEYARSTGSITISADGSAGGATYPLDYTQDYQDNGSSGGVTFTVTQSSNTVTVTWNTTNATYDAEMSYTIERLY